VFFENDLLAELCIVTPKQDGGGGGGGGGPPKDPQRGGEKNRAPAPTTCVVRTVDCISFAMMPVLRWTVLALQWCQYWLGHCYPTKKSSAIHYKIKAFDWGMPIVSGGILMQGQLGFEPMKSDVLRRRPSISQFQTAWLTGLHYQLENTLYVIGNAN